MRRKSREELIQSAREVLANDDLSNKDFRHLPIYSRIRPYLSKQAIEAVEGKFTKKDRFNTEVVEIVIGDGRNSGVNPFKNKILDELVLLERKWGLI